MKENLCQLRPFFKLYLSEVSDHVFELADVSSAPWSLSGCSLMSSEFLLSLGNRLAKDGDGMLNLGNETRTWR